MPPLQNSELNQYGSNNRQPNGLFHVSLPQGNTTVLHQPIAVMDGVALKPPTSPRKPVGIASAKAKGLYWIVLDSRLFVAV
jgi:hypothetical protein